MLLIFVVNKCNVMKIAILGYGKMGMEIEKIALSRGNEVVLKIGKDNLEDLTGTYLLDQNSDVTNIILVTEAKLALFI